MHKIKRTWTIFFILVALFVIIIARLFYIQLLDTDISDVDVMQRAQNLHMDEVMVESGRGKIVDRERRALVGEKKLQLLAFPQQEEHIALRGKELASLAQLLHVQQDVLEQTLRGLKRPAFMLNIGDKQLNLTVKEQQRINELGIPGIYVLETDQRNNSRSIAAQLIGCIRKKAFPPGAKTDDETIYSGTSGLEAAFNLFLRGSGEKLFSYLVDRREKPLNGAKPEWQQYEVQQTLAHPKQVVTTLDLRLQNNIEKLLDQEAVDEGAVVVQEIKSGDILAMASRPNSRFATTDKSHWQNRAIMATTPGSVFKIVVAIAALEEGLCTPNTVFECSGSWDKYHLHDAKLEGHGRVTLTQAFANSCNVVFAKLASRLGGAKLESYARRLGLGRMVTWSGNIQNCGKLRQLEEEEAGRIFFSDNLQGDEGAVAQSGIGQRDVQVSLLQAVNMVTALFHDGCPLSPRIASEILDEHGQIHTVFPVQYLPNRAPLKKETLQAVRRMMRQTVTDGIAKSLSDAKWPLAVKTGTAQVGVNNEKYHRWLVGFAPYDTPKYSISVLIKSLPDDKDVRVNKIFKQIITALHNLKIK